MSNELISIIVPVYKAEKYLDRCVESIVSQTYTNLEIILIDDGSPDNCPKMCDKWAKKDSRIKVIHKENGGAASARNAGLEAVTGDYIGFVDSDDYIDENMFSDLISSVCTNNSDIAICNTNDLDSNGNIALRSLNINDVIVDKYSLITLKKGGFFGAVLWNCLFKKELWDNIRFPEYRKHEDVAVLPYVYYKANKISFVDKALYYYSFVDDSIMNSGFSEKDLVLIEIYDKKLDFFKNDTHYDEIFIGALSMLRYILLSNCNEKSSEYKQFKKYSKSLLKRAKMEGIKLSGKKKLSFTVCFISPKLYSKFIKLI